MPRPLTCGTVADMAGCSCHAPLRLPEVGAAARSNKAAVPRLVRDPLDEVITVLGLVHVIVPVVRLTFSRSTAVLNNHCVPSPRKREVCSNERIHCLSIGRAHCNRRCSINWRQVQIGREARPVAHWNSHGLTPDLTNVKSRTRHDESAIQRAR